MTSIDQFKFVDQLQNQPRNRFQADIGIQSSGTRVQAGLNLGKLTASRKQRMSGRTERQLSCDQADIGAQLLEPNSNSSGSSSVQRRRSSVGDLEAYELDEDSEELVDCELALLEPDLQRTRSHLLRTASHHHHEPRRSESANKQHTSGPNSGTMMGIFFKVWSLVKVSRGRGNQQRNRRQNSEGASQFSYISGDKLRAGSARPTSGPANIASISQQQHHTKRQLLNVNSSMTSGKLEKLQNGTNSTSSTSSGVSSGAASGASLPQKAAGPSPAEANQKRPMFHYNSRRCTADIMDQQKQAKSAELNEAAGFSFLKNTSKIKRSATSIIPSEAPHLTSRFRRPVDSSASQLTAMQPTYGDDGSQFDVYSTPNDSIQSMQSQHQQIETFSGQQIPIVKSFSSTNFSQLFNNNNPASVLNACETISEEHRYPPQPDSSQQMGRHFSGAANRKTLMSGSRFFISSSSSDDSSAHLANSSHLGGLEPIKLELQPSKVALQQGIHRHSREQTRPSLSSFQSAAQSRPMSPLQQQQPAPLPTGYRRSPSLFEMSSQRQVGSSNRSSMSNGKPQLAHSQLARALERQLETSSSKLGSTKPLINRIPHSVSLYDYRSLHENAKNVRLLDKFDVDPDLAGRQIYSHVGAKTMNSSVEEAAEYKLAEMLLEFGQNVNARDPNGYTSIMHAVESDNLAAIKCLIEHGADLNACEPSGSSLLDLVSQKPATGARLNLFKLLIDNRADVDRQSASDGSRLLERLIKAHEPSQQLHQGFLGTPSGDKLPFIECLLQGGAKLGSSTWLAASSTGKRDVQLSLLRKLCQDGYYLYKKCCIEAAVFRFEYLLKWLDDFEQQLAENENQTAQFQSTQATGQQIKYQTYLGLSRCERKRKFYKRALEFAHMAILIDSTAYEAFYSKAHILKNLGEPDDALIAIDQASRLVERSAAASRWKLDALLDQEEDDLMLMDSFEPLYESPSYGLRWLRYNTNQAAMHELQGNLEYFEEAQKHIAKLKVEIQADKFKSDLEGASETAGPISRPTPISVCDKPN